VTRRAIATGVVVAAVVGAAIAAIVAGPVVRDAGFHAYADRRELLGIPGAGDVLSSFAFLFVGLAFAPLASPLLRGAPGGEARGLPGSLAVALLVAAIGAGSTVYHFAPSDTTLVADWIPIVVALAVLLAIVVRDTIGPRAGHVVLTFAPMLAVASVGYWYFTGGTVDGGDMAPYVAVQALGVALPAALALIAPGRIRAIWLLGALGLFVAARAAGRLDAEIYDAVGISGHTLKHLAAAGAAALALHALTAPRSPATAKPESGYPAG
jgi:hypothetical protein